MTQAVCGGHTDLGYRLMEAVGALAIGVTLWRLAACRGGLQAS